MSLKEQCEEIFDFHFCSKDSIWVSYKQDTLFSLLWRYSIAKFEICVSAYSTNTRTQNWSWRKPPIYQILNYLQWVCKYTYTATSTAVTATYCYILLQLLLLLLPMYYFISTNCFFKVSEKPSKIYRRWLRCHYCVRVVFKGTPCPLSHWRCRHKKSAKQC